MIEEVVLNHLASVLTDVTVVMEVPLNASDLDKYVVIEKTGSGRENHIMDSTFAVQSYAKSMYKAALLNERVKEAMDSLVELDEVTKSELNSDYNFTNETKKQYRYQAVYDITHY